MNDEIDRRVESLEREVGELRQFAENAAFSASLDGILAPQLMALLVATRVLRLEAVEQLYTGLLSALNGHEANLPSEYRPVINDVRQRVNGYLAALRDLQKPNKK